MRQNVVLCGNGLTTDLPFCIELKSAVGQIFHNEKLVLAVEQNKVLIPTNYNKYLAWGFSDLSVRIGNYESEKVSDLCRKRDLRPLYFHC